MWRSGSSCFIAFDAFVVDYGVMWVGRGQAQNAADAGALAGAVAMAFDANGWTDRTADRTGPHVGAADGADQSRSGARRRTWTWTPTCSSRTRQPRCVPPMPTALTPCIRVDVYRNQARGNPLPAIFGSGVGLRRPGRPSDRHRACGRRQRQRLPEAVGDSRQMARRLRRDGAHRPANTWTPDDNFETIPAGQHLDAAGESADVYTPPSASSPGTGFTVDGRSRYSR